MLSLRQVTCLCSDDVVALGAILRKSNTSHPVLESDSCNPVCISSRVLSNFINHYSRASLLAEISAKEALRDELDNAARQIEMLRQELVVKEKDFQVQMD